MASDALDLKAKQDMVAAINNLANTLATGYAPAAAAYLVGSTDASLSAERVVTDTESVTWDLATAGQAKANVANFSGARVATQFDATTATLANVTGLSLSLAAGKTYAFRAVLFVDADATGGHKYAIAGTATATSVIYQLQSSDNGSPGAFVLTSRQTALGGAAGEASTTAYFTVIEGTIVVNAAGTLTVQFAQNSANGTSSVLVNSSFEAWKIA